MVVENPSAVLTDRWTPLRHHDTQQRIWRSTARFLVAAAGRRSGKSELAKRKIVKEALKFHAHPDGWFILAAPTHSQAKKIFWADAKKLVPPWMIDRVFETEMTIRLVTGTEITIMGMDQPERAEGRPIDGIVLDEYGNMKPQVWTAHIRPALSTVGRLGWAWFTGTPEGRNHYYKLYCDAMANPSGKWEAYTWKSADILDPEEIEAAMRDLDPQTFDQEYNASFINFEGRVYYGFDRNIHAAKQVQYNPNLPLIFCFDFNVKPGVAVVCQEQMMRTVPNPVFPTNTPITCAIGEVWIPDNSNTPLVCRKLVHDWGHHTGEVLCYGDASGGARGSSRVAGSDWELVRKTLEPEFGSQLKMRYRHQNPKERSRVNAVNSRIMATDSKAHFMVNPKRCPHLIEDLEGVQYVEGGAGEIDKHANKMLTHISDALGYYIEKKFPVEGVGLVSSTEA